MRAFFTAVKRGNGTICEDTNGQRFQGEASTGYGFGDDLYGRLMIDMGGRACNATGIGPLFFCRRYLEM
jgi:hypothetical protein